MSTSNPTSNERCSISSCPKPRMELSDYCEEHFNLLTPGRWQAEIDRCVAIEQQKYRDLYDAMSKERLNFDKGGDTFHVLRILGNGQISAGKARELLLEMQAGINPELMPFEAESPVETSGWLPINTAPRSGSFLVALASCPDLSWPAHADDGHIYSNAHGILNEADEFGRHTIATHWHPALPRPGSSPQETSAPLTPAEMGTVARMAAVSAQVQPEKASAERCRSGHLYEGRLVQCCKDENHSGRHYNLTVDYHWGSENGSAKP